MLANPCIGAPRHRLLTGHPSQHSSGTQVPPRCSKRHRGQLVVSGELTRFSQAPQYRPASPTDRLLKRMETGRGGCCNPSPASVSDQVHQTNYPYEEAFKQDTGGSRGRGKPPQGIFRMFCFVPAVGLPWPCRLPFRGTRMLTISTAVYASLAASRAGGTVPAVGPFTSFGTTTG